MPLDKDIVAYCRGPFCLLSDETYTTKHKEKAPHTNESPFLGKATMTYSMGFLEPENNFGVDQSTFWED